MSRWDRGNFIWNEPDFASYFGHNPLLRILLFHGKWGKESRPPAGEIHRLAFAASRER